MSESEWLSEAVLRWGEEAAYRSKRICRLQKTDDVGNTEKEAQGGIAAG